MFKCTNWLFSVVSPPVGEVLLGHGFQRLPLLHRHIAMLGGVQQIIG